MPELTLPPSVHICQCQRHSTLSRTRVPPAFGHRISIFIIAEISAVSASAVTFVLAPIVVSWLKPMSFCAWLIVAGIWTSFIPNVATNVGINGTPTGAYSQRVPAQRQSLISRGCRPQHSRACGPI
ncbi:hypothetical protein EDB87DRAFT_797964 [Lactarius vividus]|nr:hypothetical protein EDB87DRAFT_797964 [Lactarius vividus]